MTTAPVKITEHDIEREICKRSFAEFLNHAKVMEPPPGLGKIDFVLWEHLLTTIGDLETERLLTILKARQVGLSWLLAAYALWKAMYHDGAVVLLLSQGQAEAAVFLGKCKYIHSELPEYLQVKIGTDSSTQMSFPDTKSKLNALPSTENAGRSETASVVIQDEADFHDHLDANYAAVKPTIDAGGQLIQVSTVNKKKMSSLYKEIYRAAPDNGFTKRFYGWNVRPERDQAWYDRVRAEAPNTAEMSSDLYMEQEYPRTEREALAPSRVLSAFDPDTLLEMEKDVRSPIQKYGKINIYQGYAVGKRYAAGSDTSHGTGNDNAVSVVLDVQTGAVVADINDPYVTPEELAEQTVKMLAIYKNPIWAIEDNEWGILTIRKAQELNYPNLFYKRDKKGMPTKVGWRTDERSRPLLWGELIEAINERLTYTPNKDGLAQFSSVIRNPDKDGRIEAMSGTHDDYPMAHGIAWQMRKYAYSTGPSRLTVKKRRRG